MLNKVHRVTTRHSFLVNNYSPMSQHLQSFSQGVSHVSDIDSVASTTVTSSAFILIGSQLGNIDIVASTSVKSRDGKGMG